MTIQLAWGAKVSTDFVQALAKLCDGFGWDADHASWLMACMAFESARTFRSDIRNAAGSGAVGLIQFMPSTAAGLGTSVDNLALLSPESQLYYVGEYFRRYAARIVSLPDMYMAILLPAAIGKPDDAPLFVGGVAYRENSGLDANDDGIVTKAEAAARVQAMLTEGLQPPNVATYAWSA
jgi:hypothetical protein